MTSQQNSNAKISCITFIENSLVASSPTPSNLVTSSSFENSSHQINETSNHIRQLSGLSSSSSSSNPSPQTYSTSSSQSKPPSTNSELKKYKTNPSLPFIFLTISATLSNSQILALITRTFHQLHFTNILTIKDPNHDTYTCIFSRLYKNCFKTLIKKCINKYSSKQFHVTIVFNKNPNSNDKYERRIVIRTIKGKEKSMEKKIISFIKQIIPFVTSIRILKHSKIFNAYSLSEYIDQCMNEQKRNLYRNKALPCKEDYCVDFKNNPNNNLTNDNTLIEISNNEASKVYSIYKILSRDDYELGKSVGQFIMKFKEKYSDIKCTVLKYKTKDIINEIVKQLDECVDTFNAVFNNKNNNEIIINNNDLNNTKVEFIRQACEQFVFNRINFILIDIYKEKYKKDNEIFLTNQRRIKEENDIDEIFKHLEIKEKFKTDDKPFPYKISIDLINMIEYEISPKKKLECLMKANLEMRNSIFDYTKGKNELESMDDELPIIIYMATQIKVSNLLAELYLIDEYLQCTLKDDLIQNKMVTNLQSAIVFISKTWYEINED